ncbi:MAG: glutaredoxin 3 [Solirubrobacterales bacterium]|jgi:glutaredoxin 3|nr:glutaredoxin 3 [Solirubrobacterales bacterium]
MASVTLYTTDRCPYCVQAKKLLDKRGVAYEEINLARDPDGRSELVAKTGMMTFPQVLVGDELIGGYTETAAADKSGRLQELLAA